MQLGGFELITLGPGKKRTVTFTIGRDDLSLIDADIHPVVEPGGPYEQDSAVVQKRRESGHHVGARGAL